jgi:broad specificity phosphatase PhoE
MMIIRLAGLLALLPFLLPSATALAQAQPEWIAAVRGGGHVIVFRHGATHREQADTDPLNLGNVAQQRHLNDAGRAKAREIGAAFRKLNIPVGLIYSSYFYRAIETANVAFGHAVLTLDLTEGGLVVPPIENDRRTAAFRRLAGTAPPAGTNAVVVTHKPNIVDAFGKDWFDVREGEASVLKPDDSGGFTLVARVQADEWAKLVQAAN